MWQCLDLCFVIVVLCCAVTLCLCCWGWASPTSWLDWHRLAYLTIDVWALRHLNQTLDWNLFATTDFTLGHVMGAKCSRFKWQLHIIEILQPWLSVDPIDPCLLSSVLLLMPPSGRRWTWRMWLNVSSGNLVGMMWLSRSMAYPLRRLGFGVKMTNTTK